MKLMVLVAGVMLALVLPAAAEARIDVGCFDYGNQSTLTYGEAATFGKWSWAMQGLGQLYFTGDWRYSKPSASSAKIVGGDLQAPYAGRWLLIVDYDPGVTCIWADRL